MNKKLLFVFSLVLGAILVACGGGGEDNSAELSALQSQVESLQADLEQAQADATAAMEERDAAMADADAAMADSGDGDAMAATGDTLQAVLDRGTLNCGVPAGVSPGFGFLEEDGSWTGFDVDYCKVVAAAVLGDANAVEFRGTTGTDRFPVLQSGEVDMLSRQTTWTISRDTSLGFDFGPTTFYDGQGMMVKADSGITDLEGLDGGTVCVAAGTTTEKNLADVFPSTCIDYEPVVFDEPDAPRAAFEEGRCDGYTTDKSGLVSVLVLFDDPSSVTILDATMSKEPLGPLVRHGDDNWFDVCEMVNLLHHSG